MWADFWEYPTPNNESSSLQTVDHTFLWNSLSYKYEEAVQIAIYVTFALMEVS